MLSFLIGPIVGFLLKRKPGMTKGYAEHISKIILIVVAIVALIAGFFIYDYFNDKAAVKNFRKDQIIEQQAETIESTARANRGEDLRAEQRDLAEDQSNETLETIHAKDPESANAPATRGNRSVADRLR